MENKELLEKARQAKSAEELLFLAKESGIELSEEEANAYFGQLNRSGELSDDELDNVAGGGCIGPKPDNFDELTRQKYEGKRVRCTSAVCSVCGSNQGIVLKFRIDRSAAWDAFWCSIYCCTHRNQLILETNEIDIDFVLE